MRVMLPFDSTDFTAFPDATRGIDGTPPHLSSSQSITRVDGTDALFVVDEIGIVILDTDGDEIGRCAFDNMHLALFVAENLPPDTQLAQLADLGFTLHAE